MVVADDNLSALLGLLAPAERRALRDHLQGRPTPASLQILRKIQFALKRRARRGKGRNVR
jgi:hypothetical protein